MGKVSHQKAARIKFSVDSAFLPLRNMEVTPFHNNVMATIIKLRNQHKRADLASIYKELTKNLTNISARIWLAFTKN